MEAIRTTANSRSRPLSTRFVYRGPNARLLDGSQEIRLSAIVSVAASSAPYLPLEPETQLVLTPNGGSRSVCRLQQECHILWIFYAAAAQHKFPSCRATNNEANAL